MKFHTCHHHIQCNEKSKLKGVDLGTLERPLIVLKFSSPNYWKYVTLCYEYGLGENLAFENLW